MSTKLHHFIQDEKKHLHYFYIELHSTIAHCFYSFGNVAQPDKWKRSLAYFSMACKHQFIYKQQQPNVNKQSAQQGD